MDTTDFQNWLNARPNETRHRDAALIAMRAAARVFPIAYQREFPAETFERFIRPSSSAFLFFRALMTAIVEVYSANPRVTSATAAILRQLPSALPIEYSGINVQEVPKFASYGGFLQFLLSSVTMAKIDQTGDLNGFETKSIYSSMLMFGQDIPLSLWDELKNDVGLIEGAADLFEIRLWSKTPSFWFAEDNERMRRIWAQEAPEILDFWTRWWDGLVTGKPLDWALQEKVALIPDAIWQQGATAVARAIRDIEEAMTPPEPSDTDMEKVIEQTRHGAVLFYDPATKLIGEEAVSTLPQDVRRDVVDLMQDVLSGFPAAIAGNNIYELIRRERDILKRAIDAYGARPWMLLTSLRRARAGVQDKVADGTCPRNDPLLNDLLAQISQAEILLVTHDAELAVAVRNQERLPDVTLTAEDLHLLTAGMQALQGHATPELSTAIEADLAAIADTNLPIPHRKAAMLSTIARLVQVRALATGKAKRSLFGNSRFGVAEVANWVNIFDGIARVLTASGAWEWILVFIQRLP